MFAEELHHGRVRPVDGCIEDGPAQVLFHVENRTVAKKKLDYIVVAHFNGPV